MGWINGVWVEVWKGPIRWIGAHVLNLAQPVLYRRTGSGDTQHDWIFLGLALALSLVIAAIWSWFDRGREHHTQLAGWLRVYLRYTLATMMLVYGIMKVFDQQFFPPHGLMLTETYGQSTPMRLAWTFVGASIPYTIFSGAMECLSGLLLFFRRTEAMGATVAAIVMSNVVMMNICYDIPVKLNATLYLIMAIAILTPHARKLFKAFLVEREPALAGWRSWARLGMKSVFIGTLFISQVSWGVTVWGQRMPEPGPLNGLYEIDGLKVDGQDHPPVFTDKARWRWMEVGATYLRIADVEGRVTPFCKATFDAKSNTLSVHTGRAPRAWEVPGPSGELTATWTDATHLRLLGTLDGKSADLLARKTDISEFPLATHRIHWISELPDDH